MVCDLNISSQGCLLTWPSTEEKQKRSQRTICATTSRLKKTKSNKLLL